ncbi:transposase [Streptomyces sp. NPDC004647]|uniref:transposase n=1 Tax=Streptomyces sp. NPDC004647 TaxID=3154671 RepID=UPI0033AB9F33
MTETLADLPHTARHDLGLREEATYRMVWYAYTLLIRALEAGTLAVPHNHPWVDRSTGELLPCPRDCPHQPIPPAEFFGRLLDASVPDSVPLTEALAIDSTDYETWARRRSWARKPDVDPDHLPVKDHKPVNHAQSANEASWPRTGHDGRAQNSLDPDARDGYRSGTNGTRGSVFCGYDLHLAVNARSLGGPETPFIITGMHLSPAGSHKGRAGVTLIDQVRARRGKGQVVTEVIGDRGYSYCKPETWAWPLRARNVEPIIDLHHNQRGQHPGPIPATVVIDGGLFSDALPHPLRDLPGFPIGMPAADKAKLHGRYDQRAAYAFTPHSRPDKDGYQRFKGPAVAGKVRCPNYPRSLRGSHTRPTTACTPGTECACGKTLTLAPDVTAWTKQRNLWGTTAWAADYGRRAAVESGNAEIKTHRLHMDRGFTRVMGTLKNSVLLAFSLAALNVILLRDWHAKRRRLDPWSHLVNEPDEPNVTKHTRAKRRTTSLATLTSGDPPG